MGDVIGFFFLVTLLIILKVCELVWIISNKTMEFFKESFSLPEIIFCLMPIGAMLGQVIWNRLGSSRNLIHHPIENDNEEVEAVIQDEIHHPNIYQEKLTAANYTGEIPLEFLDPVTQTEIMVNPVILITEDHSTSRSFDERTILKLMSQSAHPLCPLTRRPFTDYILNRDFKNTIEKWVDNTVQFQAMTKAWESSQEDGQVRLRGQGFFDHHNDHLIPRSSNPRGYERKI